MDNKKRSKRILLAGIGLALIAAIFTVVYLFFIPKGNDFDKKITVEVIYENTSTQDYVIETNAEFLRGALEEIELVAGDESEYGLYVKEVNGIVADYEKNGAFWSFTKDGEFLMSGIDTTVINDGEHYEITYTTVQ